MSSETDHPRQRTVAELLAQHGGGETASTGRRRRRRESDDDPDELGGPGPDSGAAAPSGWPPRAPEPAPRDSSPGPSTGWDLPRSPAGPPQQQYAPPPYGSRFGGAARGGSANGGHGPDQPSTGQWGAQGRREPDPSWDAPSGNRPQDPEPEPRRGQQQAPAWDAQPTSGPWEPAPLPSGAWEARPWEPTPVEAQATGQWGPAAYGAPRTEQGPREQPLPRAFPPGPEQVRGGAPHAQSPYVGPSARPGGSASPFTPARPFDQVGQATAAVYPSRQGVEDPGLTGPIDQQRLEAARQSEATSRVQVVPGERRGARADADAGPATAVGVPLAGAEDWHRARTGQPDRPPGEDDDGGPATQASALDLDDHDEIDEFTGQPAGLGPPSKDGPAAGGHEFDPEQDGGAQSWAPVLAQWVLGAIGGAALWVGFRFLWGSLLVVAIAAAVLVTAGLVVIVRAVLHNRDLRTTLTAVLVGVLLTVSPAVLVLLGR